MKNLSKITARKARSRRIRARVNGNADTPRLAVFKSTKGIYAKVIDDEKKVTIASASDLKIKKGTKMEKAKEVGKNIAEAAKNKKIEKIVFDRGGFRYFGRVKALADAAREAGLKF